MAKSIFILLLLGFFSSASSPVHSATSNKKANPSLNGPAKTATLKIPYLHRIEPDEPIRPFFDPVPDSLGLLGAQLGVADNNTTGQFTHQSFELVALGLEPEADLVKAFKNLIAQGHRLFISDLKALDLQQLARLPEAQGVGFLDIQTGDDRLRGKDCMGNVFHLRPSHAMKADALAQYLGKKRWQKWFLVIGETENDRLMGEAYRKAAKKFGAKIVDEKAWNYRFDDRRSPESEVPVLTQGPEYDVLIVTDEQRQFSDFFPYRTWSARPVAGAVGLIPSGWSKIHEGWGALQLQNRFQQLAKRPMLENDYAGWLAARTLGEAAARTQSLDPTILLAFLLNEKFALAGFKGLPLSFRPWDHQLRQPILLESERSIVAVAPIEGYLHPKNELDTLGYDQPESACNGGAPTGH